MHGKLSKKTYTITTINNNLDHIFKEVENIKI